MNAATASTTAPAAAATAGNGMAPCDGGGSSAAGASASRLRQGAAFGSTLPPPPAGGMAADAAQFDVPPRWGHFRRGRTSGRTLARRSSAAAYPDRMGWAPQALHARAQRRSYRRVSNQTRAAPHDRGPTDARYGPPPRHRAAEPGRPDRGMQHLGRLIGAGSLNSSPAAPQLHPTFNAASGAGMSRNRIMLGAYGNSSTPKRDFNLDRAKSIAGRVCSSETSGPISFDRTTICRRSFFGGPSHEPYK